MQLTIQGKQMDLGDALKTRVTEKLEEINQKYFNRAIIATVVFEPEAGAFVRAHISIRIGKAILVMAEATAGDAHAAFEEAADRVAKQMRRYKRRLRDHHERIDETPESELIKARDYVLASHPEHAEEEEEPDHVEPLIIAEMTTHIQTMSVSEAVMRMDLSGQSAMLFRNASNDGINMVYRRPDGNIGWVDPSENEKIAKKKSA